jgi:hypothetical protein
MLSASAKFLDLLRGGAWRRVALRSPHIRGASCFGRALLKPALSAYLPQQAQGFARRETGRPWRRFGFVCRGRGSAARQFVEWCAIASAC